MKRRSILIVIAAAGCLLMTVAFAGNSPDGVNPPHAVDTDGKSIPESSATQPDKPIIFSKDSKDPKYGELVPGAAFDHAKHHTDVKHTLDGATLTTCVECHHTEQRSSAKPYLKTFKRSAVLTAEQLTSSNEPVKSCRACHFQPATPKTAEYPPKSVRYPRDVARAIGVLESGELTNDNAYHGRCITCHTLASKRDATLKAPQACLECHVNKLITPTSSASPSSTAASTATNTPAATATTSPTP